MIRVHLGASGLGEVRFGAIALVDLSEAARLARDPDGGSVTSPEWWRAARQALAGASLTSALHEHGRYVPDVFALRPQARADAASDLRRLRATPGGAVRHHLRFAYGDRVPRDVQVLEQRPEEGLATLATELAAFHRTCVAPLWRRVRAVCDAELLHRGRELAVNGPEAALADLPGIRVRGAVLEVDADEDVDVHPRERGVTLVPTVFSERSLVIRDPNMPIGLSYRAAGAALAFEAPEASAADPLAALAGTTRAQLLRLLAQPYSTSDLAQLLGLAPATVSEHLATLAAAGLVSGARSGRRVLYALTDEGRAALAAVRRATS